MTPDEFRAEASRLGEDLNGWLMAYDRRGQTFRQFGIDYAVASAELSALLKREDVPHDVIEEATCIWEIPIQRGYEPEAYSPPRGPDDIIGGDDPRVARFWTRDQLNALLHYLWEKCDEIGTLEEHEKAEAFASCADLIRARLAPRHEPHFWVTIERMLSVLEICGHSEDYRSTVELEVAPWDDPPPSPRALRILAERAPASDDLFREALEHWVKGVTLAIDQRLSFTEFWSRVDVLQADVDARGVTEERRYAYWAAGQGISTAANSAGYKPYSDWLPGRFDY